MQGIGYFIIIAVFLIYYFLVLFLERRMMHRPTEILEKFLAITLTYAGISLIYFSITGRAFLNGSVDEYYVYIFLMGFIAILWAIPNLLSEFDFFEKFLNNGKKKANKKKIVKKR